MRSYRRSAGELCRRWEWRDAKGRSGNFAARSLLLKLQARCRIELPALQTQKRRAPKQVVPPPGLHEPGEIMGSLRGLGNVQLDPDKSPVPLPRVPGGGREHEFSGQRLRRA